MKHVTFEQAKWLNEKGFDVPTIKFYYLNDRRKWFKNGELGEGFNDSYWGDNTNLNWNKDGRLPFKPFSNCVSAPEQHQVIDWLLEKHGVWVQCEMGKDESKIWFNFYIYKAELSSDYSNIGYSESGLNSPQEAYSAAFDYIKNNNLI